LSWCTLENEFLECHTYNKHCFSKSLPCDTIVLHIILAVKQQWSLFLIMNISNYVEHISSQGTDNYSAGERITPVMSELNPVPPPSYKISLENLFLIFSPSVYARVSQADSSFHVFGITFSANSSSPHDICSIPFILLDLFTLIANIYRGVEITQPFHSFINGSTALCSALAHIFQFRNLF
jgi:hypothetical protein